MRVVSINKEDMVSELAQRAGMTKVSAEVALEAVISIISDALVSGDKVQLSEPLRVRNEQQELDAIRGQIFQ